MPLSDVIDDAADAARAAADHTEEVLKTVSGRARGARKAVEDGVQRVRGRIDDFGLDELNDGLGGARSFVVGRVKDKPVSATIAALGAGFFIGLIFAGAGR